MTVAHQYLHRGVPVRVVFANDDYPIYGVLLGEPDDWLVLDNGHGLGTGSFGVVSIPRTAVQYVTLDPEGSVTRGVQP